jgi:hypothetical protein
MRGYLLRCAVAALMVWAGPAGAQPPVPAPKTVSPASPDASGCNTVEKPLSAGGASIVPETGGQQKNWQPPGGEISFTVRSFVQIPADSLVVVCFRWKRSADRQDHFITARPTHLDLTDAGRVLRVTVVVPEKLGKAPPRFSGDGEYAGLYLVPLAEVRILVLAKGSDGNAAVAADVSHVIGVANPFWALLLAALTILAMFGLLSLISHRRLKRLGLGDLDPIIRIIATPDGYASLSQLQMVLWTFVVAASAVYVMVLSGELIEVTSGTLVLLGISGAVTVGTQLHDSRQSSAALAAGMPRPPQRKPMWSDLVVNEVNGQREIDVTRVQMLYFTLITALFVVMRVLTTYVIPEIPQGFQVLMGISNAVYLGSKVAQPGANTAAANAPAPGAATPPTQSG